MNALAPLAKRCALAVIAALLLFSSAYSQSPPPADRQPDRPLNLLVLGDSILWGQGLKDEHKAWYIVKSWLQQTAGREVRERIEAHSGAVIGSADDFGDSRNAVAALNGEISRAYPTVNNQIDNAIKSYADPSQVDLVLVDGCINDFDSRRLLNAANTPARIHELAQANCGPPIEALLTRITRAFPNAHVVVTGYYPILTEKTPNDLFIRALAKRLYAPEPGDAKLNDKQMRARLIANSREWYQTSDQILSAAARKIDAEQRAKGSRQRVLFADAGFEPDHSFAASKSRLWGFDASALRKLLVVFTLGRVTLKTNDERRNQRSELCEDLFTPAANEAPNEKAIRKDRLVRCRLAALGHPNRKGAAMYADAIGRLLKQLITETGWLRTAPAASLPDNRLQSVP
jgi:hypothetical protein